MGSLLTIVRSGPSLDERILKTMLNLWWQQLCTWRIDFGYRFAAGEGGLGAVGVRRQEWKPRGSIQETLALPI